MPDISDSLDRGETLTLTALQVVGSRRRHGHNRHGAVPGIAGPAAVTHSCSLLSGVLGPFGKLLLWDLNRELLGEGEDVEHEGPQPQFADADVKDALDRLHRREDPIVEPSVEEFADCCSGHRPIVARPRGVGSESDFTARDEVAEISG